MAQPGPELTLIADFFLRDPESLPLSLSLVGDLGADSLELLELTVMLNQRLGIDIPEVSLARIKTVADLIEAVRNAPTVDV